MFSSSLGSCCDLTTHGTNPSLERHRTSPMPSHPKFRLKLRFRVHSALNTHSPRPAHARFSSRSTSSHPVGEDCQDPRLFVWAPRAAGRAPAEPFRPALENPARPRPPVHLHPPGGRAGQPSGSPFRVSVSPCSGVLLNALGSGLAFTFPFGPQSGVWVSASSTRATSPQAPPHPPRCRAVPVRATSLPRGKQTPLRSSSEAFSKCRPRRTSSSPAGPASSPATRFRVPAPLTA